MGKRCFEVESKMMTKPSQGAMKRNKSCSPLSHSKEIKSWSTKCPHRFKCAAIGRVRNVKFAFILCCIYQHPCVSTKSCPIGMQNEHSKYCLNKKIKKAVENLLG